VLCLTVVDVIVVVTVGMDTVVPLVVEAGIAGVVVTF
jgi:hypothetical protein